MKIFSDINLKIVAAASLAAVLSYFFADRQITLFFSVYKDTPFYDAFRIITKMGKAEYLLVPSLAVWLWTRKRNKYLAKVASAVFISVAVAGLSVDVIKFFVGRIRPVLFLEQGLYGFDPFKFKYEYISFPSGHTAVIFGSMWLLVLRYKKYAAVFILVALLVGLSRVITLHHFTSDVIMGAVAGYASACAVNKKMFGGDGI